MNDVHHPEGPFPPGAPDPGGAPARTTDPALEVRVHRVAVDGTHVRVGSSGQPGDRAFVLVAGPGIAETSPERLVSHLDGNGPVHALDLPGSPGVPWFRGAVSIERYADAVEQVIDHLGLHDPVLIGHSMGAQVVVEVAARRPDVSDVVLISPVLEPGSRSVSKATIRFLRSAVHEPSAVRWHGVTTSALGGWHWFRTLLPAMIAYPIEERAADVQAHTLVVRGEHDALVPRSWIRRLARVLPYAVLREVVDGGHSVMQARADAVARIVVAHVDGRLRDRGVSSLQRVRDDSIASDLDRLSATDRWLVVRSRFLQLIGRAERDDEQLGAAEQSHVGATTDGDGAPVVPGVRGTVADTAHPRPRGDRRPF
ncbi:alpha/beta fold hydrolase [Curtobacterium sp. MCPF17_031]|uniref:alpha/beta fold hydrolase n=1 Tax=Curtobacterium sp. MCPF17_031 TaxID=2175653 RepID=UPI000DAABC40|nr:alpha/beta hydrolase [Curtobacterium sp. MCPF17_031]PZE35827.1 alpha/beta hydrolase [Curtobacterium sp. MCPF17_031]